MCCKVYVIMMFWKVDLGLSYYFWISIELMVNLPTGK